MPAAAGALLMGLLLADAFHWSDTGGQDLPMAFAIGLFALTAGQFVLQNLAPVGALSILIEFVGGTVFLIVLFRKRTTA